MSLPLACTVRECGLLLERHGRTFACARGHAYDVARRGYLNLLQPQDRRSRAAGDTRAAVAARARLLAAGVGRAVVDTVVQRLASLELQEHAVVADLGSGSGAVLGELAAKRSIEAIGIDLSIAAVEHAVRRFPHLTWVVANADRRLPLLDRSVDIVISMHGRRNPAECARVLARDGLLLVAIPAPDDLTELRARVQGQALARERAHALLAEHEPFFTLADRAIISERQQLGRDALHDLLRGTYRGERVSVAGKVEELSNLEVTLASELFVFATRPTS